MKNQVEKNRLVLPLGQTIFLPQTAMGVSYIDKVRTRVYLDSLQRMQEPDCVCLRGYYEIDLEYHGLEGKRLYKHRVMLPLRAELPADWLAPLEYEPEELHVVITKPMLRILSPYVLEFGAGLAVDYVGDRLYREDKAQQDKAQQEKGEEVSMEEHLEAEQTEMRQRLESKFGSPGSPKPLRKAGQPQPDYHLPVWSEKKPEILATPTSEETPAKPEQPASAVKPVAEEVALPQPEPGKLRSMLTAAAISRLQARGEVLTENLAESHTGKDKPQEVIIMEPPTVPVASVQVAGEKPAAEIEPVKNNIKTENTEVEPVVTEKEITETAAEPEVEEVGAAKTAEPETEAVMAEKEAVAPAEVFVPAKETGKLAVETGAETEEVVASKAASDYADELAAEVAAAANRSVQETAATAEPVEAAATAEPAEAAEAAETEDAAENGAIKGVNAGGVRLRVGLRDSQKITPVPKPADRENQDDKSQGGFCLKYYVVKPGDDPMSIALKHNVPLERLRESNKALAGDLTVGTVLRIPV